jgi:hypothetical protein
MVTIILRGGLGNQLFQYATGRAHSLRTDSDLYIDTSQFNRNLGPDVAKQSLHLDTFDLPVESVQEPSKDGLNWKISGKIRRVVAIAAPQLAIYLFNLYVENRSLMFDSNVINLPGDVTLDGYWQSEQYFDDFTETLRREISVCNPLRGENSRWYERISNTDSISVHVRRGDYVSLGRELPQIYYRNALDHIYRETEATSIFFFSDDMSWIRDHIQKLLPESIEFNINYIECNDGETAYEDLRLMRSCDYHIIANSTFSWWGAWLDCENDTTIIAPDYWIREPVDKLDIIPNRWTTVGW